ncbi:MAG: DUF2461 domain-containing protein [Eubacterium sp.]|nr:DUF2461 domain-containing protein [Eubacterium sp.]
MFQGFNNSTIKYFEAIKKENSKSIFLENNVHYLEGIKYPLEELYYELYSYFSRLDSDLLSSKRRCISSAYNDARFCNGKPMKEYFYIRFKLNRADKKNEVGFFFDASLDGYKFGLNIYHMNAGGMEKIRQYMLCNKRNITKTIKEFNATNLLEVYGEKYVKSNYPNENKVLQEWLEKKNLSYIHEEPLNQMFYDREILNTILWAFDSVKNVYMMLKEALA